MIEYKTKYQITIFGDYTNFNASSDNTIKILTTLDKKNEFTTNTLQEIINGQMEPRISLINNKSNITINFLSQRIDITNNTVELIKSANNLDIFIDTAIQYLNSIDNVIKIKGKRIAFKTENVLKEFDSEKLSAVYLDFNKPIGFYSKNNPFEWNSRSVSLKDIKVEEKSETLNIITEIKRMQGSIIVNNSSKKIDRLLLLFDINTVGQNKEERFYVKQITDFIQESRLIRSDLTDQYREKIENA